ncbi:DUF6456 domain-containing protein [uncultured Roseobacter sp.]|uniref:DUF6456 domain-containing protein n=1 Tax=uncultured Roseobacter sp. TaxID=114847 RepID=UPI0026254242|nr:DUF6456 domain-containing protein [uncultured Roseobacter sp.]
MKHATLLEPDKMLPDWVPSHVLIYVTYKALNLSMRETAKLLSIQPSTVSRNVRKVSGHLADPLFYSGVDRLVSAVSQSNSDSRRGPKDLLSRNSGSFSETPHTNRVPLRNHLKRLSEPSMILAASEDLSSCAIIHKSNSGQTNNSCSVDTETAEKLAVSGLVIPSHQKTQKILTYSISPYGRRNLRSGNRNLSMKSNYRSSTFSDIRQPFPSLRPVSHGNSVLITGDGYGKEAPLQSLARRRDRYGNPFLTMEQIEAGRILREDYEMNSLTISAADVFHSADRFKSFPQSAELDFVFHNPGERLENALNYLGPVLADVAVQCCCHFKGMEDIEREFDWSARSGKIVLRIALSQLSAFYSANTARIIDPVRPDPRSGPETKV